MKQIFKYPIFKYRSANFFVSPFLWICVFIISLGTLSSCTTTNDSLQTEYADSIESYSAKKELHHGLMNVLQIQGTYLNSAVLRLQLQKKSRGFNWTTSEIDTAMTKMDESLRSETTIFLSFFSPTPKLDDLDKIQTVWKIFLDVNNKRYEGKAVRQSGIYEEFQEFFPYHTRFGTPYKIFFNVPAIDIEIYPSKLTLTGTLGTASLDFPKR